MRETIPEKLSAVSFEPADLDAMQEVFNAACAARAARTLEHRAAIANVILEAYAQGERDREKLLEAAMAMTL